MKRSRQTFTPNHLFSLTLNISRYFRIKGIWSDMVFESVRFQFPIEAYLVMEFNPHFYLCLSIHVRQMICQHCWTHVNEVYKILESLYRDKCVSSCQLMSRQNLLGNLKWVIGQMTTMQLIDIFQIFLWTTYRLRWPRSI